jgi:hypothetical protein
VKRRRRLDAEYHAAKQAEDSTRVAQDGYQGPDESSAGFDADLFGEEGR